MEAKAEIKSESKCEWNDEFKEEPDMEPNDEPSLKEEEKDKVVFWKKRNELLLKEINQGTFKSVKKMLNEDPFVLSEVKELQFVCSGDFNKIPIVAAVECCDPFTVHVLASHGANFLLLGLWKATQMLKAMDESTKTSHRLKLITKILLHFDASKVMDNMLLLEICIEKNDMALFKGLIDLLDDLSDNGSALMDHVIEGRHMNFIKPLCLAGLKIYQSHYLKAIAGYDEELFGFLEDAEFCS